MDPDPSDDPSHQEEQAAVACTNDGRDDLTFANSNDLLASLRFIARRSSLDIRIAPLPSQQPSGQIWRSDFGHALDRDFPPEERLLAINANVPRQPRVYKPVRVRTHATCHMCNTRFRGSPQCPQCQHRRCARCPKALPRGVQALIDQTKKEILTIASNYQQRPTIGSCPFSFRPGSSLLDTLDLPSTRLCLLPETAREYCEFKLTPLQHASALSSREVNLTFEQTVARYESESFNPLSHPPIPLSHLPTPLPHLSLAVSRLLLPNDKSDIDKQSRHCSVEAKPANTFPSPLTCWHLRRASLPHHACTDHQPSE